MECLLFVFNKLFFVHQKKNKQCDNTVDISLFTLPILLYTFYLTIYTYTTSIYLQNISKNIYVWQTEAFMLLCYYAVRLMAREGGKQKNSWLD